MKTPAPWLPVIGQGSTTKPKHWSLSSLDYPNPTHAQWMGDRAIIKIVPEFSADLHCCSGRLDGACDVDHRRNCEGVLVKKER